MDLFFGLTIFLYVISTLAYFAYFLFQKERLHNLAYYLLGAGFLCHSLVLGYGYIQLGHLPVQNLHETLSIGGWTFVFMFLIFQFKFNIKVLGALAAPLAALTVIVAAFLPKAPVPIEHLGSLLKNIWLTLHIGFIFGGDAAFALAGIVGCLYLLQENAIKSKSWRFFFRRLPSLELLDSMGYACVAIGFPLLTIGIMTGCIYAQIVWGKYWSWDPKEVWSLITWLLYAALLHGRFAIGWRGRKAAIIAIGGLFVLLFTFLGVNFFLKGHHGIFTEY